MLDNPQIKIPKAESDEIVRIPIGQLGKIDKKIEKLNGLIVGIVAVMVVSFIGIIISVVGIFLDQLRFNGMAYRDYSEKMEIANESRSINKHLLERNLENQEKIINLQEELLKSLEDGE